MKVAVLVKQTPQLSEVSWSGENLSWPDDALVVNPFDEYAVEEAIRIKEKTNGTTIAITYGHAEAESALTDVLALGIDEAYHIVSDKYSFTDPQGPGGLHTKNRRHRSGSHRQASLRRRFSAGGGVSGGTSRLAADRICEEIRPARRFQTRCLAHDRYRP